MSENKTIKAKSFDEFKKLIVESGCFSPIGFLTVEKLGKEWAVRDLACAPDDIVGRYTSLDEALKRFKREGKTLYEVWREVEFPILDED